MIQAKLIELRMLAKFTLKLKETKIELNQN